MKKSAEYVALRNKHLPNKIKAVFVLESPPASGMFFYEPSGRTTEALFGAFMKALKAKPRTKEEGLELFRKRGLAVIDPIYVPVNRLPERRADKLIRANIPKFLKDLSSLIGKKTPVVIIKKNVYCLLAAPLLMAGFNVINRGPIPFPSRFHSRIFIREIRKLSKFVG